jgi:hypothetical protein
MGDENDPSVQMMPEVSTQKAATSCGWTDSKPAHKRRIRLAMTFWSFKSIFLSASLPPFRWRNVGSVLQIDTVLECTNAVIFGGGGNLDNSGAILSAKQIFNRTGQITNER